MLLRTTNQPLIYGLYLAHGLSLRSWSSVVCQLKRDKEQPGRLFVGLRSQCSNQLTFPSSHPSLYRSTMKVEICAFSGNKIYPGRGRLYVRSDNRVSTSICEMVEQWIVVSNRV